MSGFFLLKFIHVFWVSVDDCFFIISSIPPCKYNHSLPIHLWMDLLFGPSFCLILHYRPIRNTDLILDPSLTPDLASVGLHPHSFILTLILICDPFLTLTLSWSSILTTVVTWFLTLFLTFMLTWFLTLNLTILI